MRSQAMASSDGRDDCSCRRQLRQRQAGRWLKVFPAPLFARTHLMLSSYSLPKLNPCSSMLFAGSQHWLWVFMYALATTPVLAIAVTKLVKMECWKWFVVCFLLLDVAMSRSLQEQEHEQEQKNYFPPSTGASSSHSNGGAPGSSTPSGGASYHHGSGSYGTPTGGHYNSPPATGDGGHSSPAYPSPSTPAGNPRIPPFFTGSCKYWGSHPEIIAAILGSMGNIGDIFGHGCAAFFGGNPSLPAALTNTRLDGYGELFREGTAAFLNSMVNSKFPYTTPQVKSAFVGAIASDGAAQAQADVFKQANEAR